MSSAVGLQHSVKTRVTLFTLAIFVASLWALAWVAADLLRGNLQQQAGAQQRTSVALLANQIDDQIRTRLSVLNAVAQSMAGTALDRTVDLQALLHSRPGVQALFNGGLLILDAGGVVRASVPVLLDRVGRQVTLDAADLSRLRQSSLAFVAHPMMGPFLGTPAVPMVVPLRDAQGRATHWLVGLVDVLQSSFLDHLGQLSVDQSASFLVVSRPHRMVVTASDRSRIFAASPAPGLDPEMDRYMEGVEGTSILTNTAGVSVMMSVAAISAARWHLVTQLPVVEVFKPVAVVQQRLWLAVAALTLLAAALTWWMLRRQLQPLVQAAETLAGWVDAASVPAPLPRVRDDEIGVLMDRFNQLLAQLGQRENTLKQQAQALTQSNQGFQAILQNVPQLIWLKDPQGRYLGCNLPFEAFMGISLAALQGKTDEELYSVDQARMFLEQDQRCLQARQPEVLERWVEAPAGTQRILLEITKVALRDAQGQASGILGIGRDVTSGWRMKQFEQLRSRVLELLTLGAELPQMLQTLTDGLRALHPDWSCMLLLVEPDASWGQTLKVAASAGLSAEFTQAIDGLVVNEDNGGCACAAFTGQRVVVSDIASHPSWNHYRALAQRAGLGACWSQPMCDAQGQVLGVFSVYQAHPATPVAADFELLEHLARLAEIAVERRQSTQRLSASEASFRALAEHTPEAVLVHRGGRILYANPSAVRLFGAGSAADLVGTLTQDRIAPDCLPQQLARMQAIERADAIEPMVESRFVRLDGSEFHVEVQGTAIVYAGLPAIHVSIRDITQRKHDEQQLRVAASVFSHAVEGILITTPDARIIDANAAFTRITGYSRDEVLGQSPRLLSSGRHGPEFYQVLWQSLLTQGYWSGEMWNRRKDGQTFVQMQHISAVTNDKGEVVQYVSLFSDITARKAQEAQLNHLAHFDSLTGLPNRALHADRLQQAMAQVLRRGKTLALVFLDLDGFKAINDTHGHAAGDHLLVALAQRMKQGLREGDTLARIGGDEFAAVLVDLNQPLDCEPLLRRLLEAASEPVFYGEIPLQVSASVGVSLYPQAQDISADELLQQADQAMYRAKQAGKNRFHVFPPTVATKATEATEAH
ncbi:diguanylate cyclase [Rhodoferax sp.]|uniref:diguanylate cyclase domain-containing protein n=1 Tax=Rhodoferax sp. TaxID=50421 RepID=UPI002637F360|nr:diguanylate cyclase [Rhodoferax sp.]MDD2924599.1 diguanylate cyclase [Rhodoferax sp.]